MYDETQLLTNRREDSDYYNVQLTSSFGGGSSNNVGKDRIQTTYVPQLLSYVTGFFKLYLAP